MPKPEPRPLRTLPERAFRARARLVAALLCCVCFAGLAARLAYLQLFTGSWYTSRALGQQLRRAAGRQQQLLDPAGLPA